ncbi:MAG TPA: polysaccharide deacetylase family protein [Steroidobacteraceae bacterium]|jgi:peptidoglycan/xylan/chitin deacetylase (PgdA/CDA1 family)
MNPPAIRFSPLLRVSVALHVLAAAVTLLRPHWWPWTLAALIADHLLLTALGLWPRSHALGSNWTRLPGRAAARGEIAITIDDGPDPDVTPQVLAILAQHGARATFFCIAERVERYPLLARDCAQQGHAVENHSQRHSHGFAFYSAGALRGELERAQRSIERICGARPRFFRAPAGLRSPLLDPVLQRLGLQLASWTRRGFDTVNADPRAVLARLTAGLVAGDILLLHDGHAARTSAGRPVVLEVLPELLAAIHQRGLRTVTLREAAG